MAYDEKCLELARYFLLAEPAQMDETELAQWIQDATEDWLEQARDLLRGNV